jgi:acetolactate synthase-1/2/3 large subunit
VEFPDLPDPTTTVGDLTAAFLEACGVDTAFGVISIHNMPILDAFGRRNRTRFVPARGEAGALNMADAYARISGGLGVGITSTGVGAANAAGSLVEALTAGTPLLHLTGQIELDYLDRAMSYIHEAPKQPDMLKGVSKAYFRIWKAEQALGVLREAVRVATTPPMGPVSVEIPIDVQGALVAIPEHLDPLPVAPVVPNGDDLDAVAAMLESARRPLLWLGGGAWGAVDGARRLLDMGIGVVTSVNGRGVVPEDNPLSLGAYNVSAPVEAFYGSCDLMVICGSRLRGNETFKYTLKLPERRVQIDADPSMDGRSYANDRFVQGDAALVLDGLADRIDGKMQIDSEFAGDLAAAKTAARASLQDNLGPAYTAIADDIVAAFPSDAAWVRDITVSNSMWGNRYLPLQHPRQAAHSLGGAIGQGLSMSVGAALAQSDRKTVLLSGDGGFMLNVGELATAAQEQADITIVLMNDAGYGVIKNIQDAQYGGRKVYADMGNPDFAQLCASMGVPHEAVNAPEQFAAAFDRAMAATGPAMVEVDMTAIGPFTRPFAGPPVRK